MAKKKRKEPVVVLVAFLVIQVGLIVAFALRGEIAVLEEFDWKQLAILGGILFFIYILYVELRGKRMGQRIVEEKVKTHTLVDSMPQAVVVVDGDGGVVSANDAACSLLGADRVSSVGAPAAALFDDGTARTLASSTGGKFDGAAKGGRRLRITVAPLRGEAGRLLVLEDAGTPVPVKSSGAAPMRPPAPSLWEGFSGLDPLFDRMDGEIRQATADAMIRVRGMLDRAGEVEALPEKAEKSRQDVGDLLKKATEKVAPAVKAKKLRLDLNLEGEITAAADGALLLRALEEILVNACTYTPEGGTIRAEASGTDREISLRVTDTGVGIPSEEFPRIFDPGFTGTRQVPAAEGGGGIGLALARKVISSHGGSIWVESETGRGTRISITIPRS